MGLQIWGGGHWAASPTLPHLPQGQAGPGSPVNGGSPRLHPPSDDIQFESVVLKGRKRNRSPSGLLKDPEVWGEGLHPLPVNSFYPFPRLKGGRARGRAAHLHPFPLPPFPSHARLPSPFLLQPRPVSLHPVSLRG